MQKYNILIIEDDDLMQSMLVDSLKNKGYSISVSDNGLDGLRIFQKSHYDLIILDLKLPKMDGMTVLKKVKEDSEETPIILMTAYGTVETAVEAMKLGAFDYLTKPFLADELALIIKKALELRDLKRENRLLKEQLNKKYSLNNIIGKSKVMQDVYNRIENIADLKSTVLIEGESGTGKELIAETIHHLSSRKNKPLIKVSCAGLTETLLESELFGYEKGAFTGALKRREGRFELADNGTLFFDDIDDINLEIQVKLLRVLQEKEFERVGGTETIKVDVRFLAAVKKNLKEEVEKGNFREDLYYRLNVIPINIPPLRERKEDIPLLLKHFLEKYNLEMKKNVFICPEVLQLLISYNWPGNIREFKNIIERIVAISTESMVKKNLLPSYIKAKKKKWKAAALKQTARDAEKECIIKTLELTKLNKTEAASILEITTKTLWQKIKEYGIE